MQAEAKLRCSAESYKNHTQNSLERWQVRKTNGSHLEKNAPLCGSRNRKLFGIPSIIREFGA
jgi:hypothetical protein